MKTVSEKLRDGDYKNKLKWPSPKDALTCPTCKKGTLGSPDINFCGSCGFDLRPHREADKAAMRAYNKEEGRILDEFKKDAFEELDISGYGKRAELAWNLAWEHGHSSGLHDVWNWLIDLADLVKEEI